jgi:hypothetical protein
MLKLLSLAAKISLFALAVLILGNRLHWGGRTVSDQVRVGMAHAERSHWVGTLRGWAEKMIQDVRKGYSQKPRSGALNEKVALSEEEIAPYERQRLRALIKELNGPARN